MFIMFIWALKNMKQLVGDVLLNYLQDLVDWLYVKSAFDP
jgi:hypothetical protein